MISWRVTSGRMAAGLAASPADPAPQAASAAADVGSSATLLSVARAQRREMVMRSSLASSADGTAGSRPAPSVRASGVTPPLEPTPEVRAALAAGQPVVALESTIISHGFPYPDNLALARDLERTVRAGGAVPAT